MSEKVLFRGIFEVESEDKDTISKYLITKRVEIESEARNPICRFQNWMARRYPQHAPYGLNWLADWCFVKSFCRASSFMSLPNEIAKKAKLNRVDIFND